MLKPIEPLFEPVKVKTVGSPDSMSVNSIASDSNLWRMVTLATT